MKIPFRARLLALGFLFLVIIVGAGFWVWSWWQRKNAPFVCPVAWQYCRKAKLVQLPSGKPAIGFVVPEGADVFASISGLAIQGGYHREDGKADSDGQETVGEQVVPSGPSGPSVQSADPSADRDDADAAGRGPALDLYRIKGIGSEYADLLELAGVDTVPELAQRNAQNLYQALVEVNAEKKLVRRMPTPGQVADWIEQAKQLPRVIHY